MISGTYPNLNGILAILVGLSTLLFPIAHLGRIRWLPQLCGGLVVAGFIGIFWFEISGVADETYRASPWASLALFAAVLIGLIAPTVFGRTYRRRLRDLRLKGSRQQQRAALQEMLDQDPEFARQKDRADLGARVFLSSWMMGAGAIATDFYGRGGT